MEVERWDRAPRPLPVAVGARDQNDGPAEALDEPRCDDADHTLVPVLSGDNVCTSRALVLRPLLDLRRCLAEDARLDRLALAVQVLERVRESTRLVGVVGQEEL